MSHSVGLRGSAVSFTLHAAHKQRADNETEEEAESPGAKTCNHTFSIRGQSRAPTLGWMISWRAVKY